MKTISGDLHRATMTTERSIFKVNRKTTKLNAGDGYISLDPAKRYQYSCKLYTIMRIRQVSVENS